MAPIRAAASEVAHLVRVRIRVGVGVKVRVGARVGVRARVRARARARAGVWVWAWVRVRVRVEVGVRGGGSITCLRAGAACAATRCRRLAPVGAPCAPEQGYGLGLG